MKSYVKPVGDSPVKPVGCELASNRDTAPGSTRPVRNAAARNRTTLAEREGFAGSGVGGRVVPAQDMFLIGFDAWEREQPGSNAAFSALLARVLSARFIRHGRYEPGRPSAVPIAGCAIAASGVDGTWIQPSMRAACRWFSDGTWVAPALAAIATSAQTSASSTWSDVMHLARTNCRSSQSPTTSSMAATTLPRTRCASSLSRRFLYPLFSTCHALRAAAGYV